MTVSTGTCFCGHLFGSASCLAEHSARKAAMQPVEVIPHEHTWLRPVNGVMYCGTPTCDAIARIERGTP